ncbi:LANO_0F09494g1_1 [Lachancea nothofagi CBS 11611]|uniref:LANO_0F09494g1_1 n=1 Tax=Lachancea nothofagi CBS 11611 TaxID=1266666 RepID=A0A1G4K9X2_9SACH|nr:LANO_0F09494g1_1 [Lachancea nothofagi CBS 11611]
MPKNSPKQIPKFMKAIQLTRDSASMSPVIALREDIPVPAAAPGQLLVKVRASAIQPSDLWNARGGFPYTTYPRIPGRDFAGIIAAGPRCGEEVYGTSGFTHAFTADGFHAEYCLVPEDAVAPKPKNLSFTQAASVGVPLTTAALVLRKGFAKSSDVVFVIGAFGAVGSAVVQLARAQGCTVLTGSRDDNADVNTKVDENLEGLATLTQGRGVDLVIDTVGIPALTKAAIENLAHSGRISIIAAPGDVDLVVDMRNLYRQEKTLIGCNSLSYSVQGMAQELAAMTSKFEEGTLVPGSEDIWTKIGLEQAVDVCKGVYKEVGKFVIVMD